MYVSLDGRELLSKEDIIIDKINSFMKVDVLDVPFRHIGFVYNFSKSNLRQAINYLRILADKAIDYISDPELTVKSITYENGVFNIGFNYRTRQLNYSIDSNET